MLGDGAGLLLSNTPCRREVVGYISDWLSLKKYWKIKCKKKLHQEDEQVL